MKIDRNLVDNNLPQEKITAFQKYLFDNIHLGKSTGFNKFITSIWGYILEIVLLGGGAWMTWWGSIHRHSTILFLNNTVIFIVGIIFVCVSLFGFSFSKGIKKKILNNSIENLKILSISRKWFSNYDLKDEDVNNFQSKEMWFLMEKYKKSPQDASIDNVTGPISIKVKNITTTFFVVTWLWTCEETDEEGKTTTTYNDLDQIYMFDYGFSEKWDKFEFSLNKERASFFKKRKQSLENENFDKTFKYTHNNEIQLRMIFTPSVQENFLSKFKWGGISIHKVGDFMITTCENEKISQKFSPFTLKLGTTRLNEELIKNNVANDLIANFKLLMTFMGHTRIMYTLYE